MVFGQERQCQDWARLSGPKYLCRASTPIRRGLVNMWKIIYFHSVWPNLNQDRRKLESPVSMSWEHPLPNASLPDQTAHLRIRIMVIVKVKWSWSASLFLQLLEIWVYLSPPSPPANPLRARGPSKGTWVVLKWHQQLSLKVLTYFPFDLQWYHQLRINFPIELIPKSHWPPLRYLCVHGPVHGDLLLLVKPTKVKPFIFSLDKTSPQCFGLNLHRWRYCLHWIGLCTGAI